MRKLWEDFKFGVGLGMGLIVAYGVLKLILLIVEMVLSGAARHQGGTGLP